MPSSTLTHYLVKSLLTSPYDHFILHLIFILLPYFVSFFNSYLSSSIIPIVFNLLQFVLFHKTLTLIQPAINQSLSCCSSQLKCLVLFQLSNHKNSSNLDMLFQSGLKSSYKTKTTLLNVIHYYVTDTNTDTKFIPDTNICDMIRYLLA